AASLSPATRGPSHGTPAHSWWANPVDPRPTATAGHSAERPVPSVRRPPSLDISSARPAGDESRKPPVRPPAAPSEPGATTAQPARTPAGRVMWMLCGRLRVVIPHVAADSGLSRAGQPGSAPAVTAAFAEALAQNDHLRTGSARNGCLRPPTHAAERKHADAR